MNLHDIYRQMAAAGPTQCSYTIKVYRDGVEFLWEWRGADGHDKWFSLPISHAVLNGQELSAIGWAMKHAAETIKYINDQ